MRIDLGVGVCVCVCVFVCACAHAYAHSRKHTRTHARTHAHKHPFTHTQHTHTQHTHAHTQHTHTHPTPASRAWHMKSCMRAALAFSSRLGPSVPGSVCALLVSSSWVSPSAGTRFSALTASLRSVPFWGWEGNVGVGMVVSMDVSMFALYARACESCSCVRLGGRLLAFASCVCACACVHVRARVRARVCVRACLRLRAYMCMRAHWCVCVRTCLHMRWIAARAHSQPLHATVSVLCLHTQLAAASVLMPISCGPLGCARSLFFPCL